MVELGLARKRMHLKCLMIHLVSVGEYNQRLSRLKSYHVCLSFCFWEKVVCWTVDLENLVLMALES
jgi:hypothetical protein